MCHRNRRQNSYRSGDCSVVTDSAREGEFQAGGGSSTAEQANPCDPRRHHEGDWLAAAFRSWVRKKLGLTLQSQKGDGDRVYRIVSGKTIKPKAKADIRRRSYAPAVVDPAAIEVEVDYVRSLGIDALRKRWRLVYREDPTGGTALRE